MRLCRWLDRAELTPGQMPTLAGDLPLATGNWNLLAPAAGGEVTVAVARHLLPGLSGYRPAGSHEIRPRPYRVDVLRLQVRAARAASERGGYAQRQSELRKYPRALAKPVRDLAVFDTFGGRQFGCNPRAVYEQPRRVRPDLEFAWVSHDGQFLVPHGDRTVLAGSPAHFEALAQARYIVFNDALPGWFRKRSDQLCMQTWHGTPLKRIGFDIAPRLRGPGSGAAAVHRHRRRRGGAGHRRDDVVLPGRLRRVHREVLRAGRRARRRARREPLARWADRRRPALTAWWKPDERPGAPTATAGCPVDAAGRGRRDGRWVPIILSRSLTWSLARAAHSAGSIGGARIRVTSTAGRRTCLAVSGCR